MRAIIHTKTFLYIFSLCFYYSVFLKGFFPIKSGLQGHSNSLDYAFPVLNNDTFGVSVPEAAYDRLVIIVIDALRADFVFSSDSVMKFTKGKLKSNHSVSFLAKTQPPTVTLPRIKALTTGGIPGFVDVVLNFGSTALLEDNLIWQLRDSGKKIIFFGDDTWMNLFPDHFVRYDGTNSFFVTDYTEVDNNVTRHLDSELARDDWDVMILHYLGLDHIGHLAGPKSPLIGPKLEEMDRIIEKIYTAMEGQKSHRQSLIMVCGDHGMSDQGSHGGASESEIIIPLVFFTPRAQIGISEPRISVQQIDVVPTLSIVLGLPIPKNNLGVMMEGLLSQYNLENRVRAHQINAQQLVQILQQNLPDINKDSGYLMYERILKKHKTWLDAMKNTLSVESWKNIGADLIEDYRVTMKMIQSTLSSSLVTYDLHAMVTGIIGLFMILSALCLWKPSDSDEAALLDLNDMTFFIVCSVFLFGHMVVCTSQHGSTLLCQVQPPYLFIPICVTLTVTFLLKECLSRIGTISAKVYVYRSDILKIALVSGTVLHTFSLLSSSFVEEEHQLWYFFTVTIHLLLILHLAQKHFKTEMLPVNSINLKSESFTSDMTMYTEVPCSREKKDIESLSKKITKKMRTFQWHKFFPLTAVLGLHRVLRTWNQTGNKWMNELDSGDWLMIPENKMLLSIAVLFLLGAIYLTKYKYHSITVNILAVVGLCSVYCYRTAQGTLYMPVIYSGISKGILEARVTFAVVFLIIMKCLFSSRKPTTAVINRFEEILLAWILFMALILRVHNICLVAMLSLMETVIQRYFITQTSISTESLTYYCLWMANAAFFYQGNSNSISTVDVSAGFVGIQDYWPVVIGFLMSAATYAGPVFWLIAMAKYHYIQVHLLNDKQKSKRWKEHYSIMSDTLLLTRALPLSIYTILVTFQRYHLFVWTVFSPKLLYEGMLVVILCLFIIIYGAVLKLTS